MTAPLREPAYGKVNLCLLVGAPRADGYHPLVSVVQSVSLADELTLEPALDNLQDVVVCRGVEGENLAGRALALFREASGWDGPPQRLTIGKRVPVAAGMGGGSGDAAAALRLAARAAGLAPDDPLLAEIAPRLGADVPSQLQPGRTLISGVGEHVERLPPDPAPPGMLILPSSAALSTPAVYAEHDRLTAGRSAAELAAAHARLRGAGQRPTDGSSAVNDLEPPARSLCPAIEPALAAARAAGCARAMVSGSGPTVLALFATPEEAERAAAAIDWPGAVAVRPVDGPGQPPT